MVHMPMTIRQKLAAWWDRNKAKARQAERAYKAEQNMKLKSGNWQKNRRGKLEPMWSIAN
jgi:hypothetical protein